MAAKISTFVEGANAALKKQAESVNLTDDPRAIVKPHLVKSLQNVVYEPLLNEFDDDINAPVAGADAAAVTSCSCCNIHHRSAGAM